MVTQWRQALALAWVHEIPSLALVLALPLKVLALSAAALCQVLALALQMLQKYATLYQQHLTIRFNYDCPSLSSSSVTVG